MPTPLTNEIVDIRLKGRNIVREEDFLTCADHIGFRCLVCNHKWRATPNKILHAGHGCPSCGRIRCSQSNKLTNEVVDIRLEGRMLKRIGDYVNTKTHIDFECLVCHGILKACPSDILGGMGCKHCRDRAKRLTNDGIDQQLVGRNIKRISEYVHRDIKMTFSCLICRYEWKTRVRQVIHEHKGCANCAGNARLTNQIIDQRLGGRDIERVDDYKSCRAMSKWLCLKCNNVWEAKTDNVVNGEQGCPECSSGKNEKSINSFFVKSGVPFVYHQKLKGINKDFPALIVDFYFPDTQTIVEYNGRQHYQPVVFGNMSEMEAVEKFKKQSKRDKLLEKLCDANQINLIWIDGRKYKDKKLLQFVEEDILPSAISGEKSWKTKSKKKTAKTAKRKTKK